jgi:SHS2 domain-containing protein
MSSWYTLLDHPADLGIEAHGESEADAFGQAAKGLIAVIVDPSTVIPAVSREVSVTAADPQQLLIRWLSEILYLYDAEHFITCEINIHELGDNHLRAIVSGNTFEPPLTGARTDVKAVTYHQLTLFQDGNGWTVRFFLDI